MISSLLHKIQNITKVTNTSINIKTDNEYKEDNNNSDDDDDDDVNGTTTNSIEEKQYKRMRRYCGLLARLGMTDEARQFYCDFICSNIVV